LRREISAYAVADINRNHKNHSGRTPFLLAAAFGQDGVVALLRRDSQWT
jgi:ankyrin repeat protein